MRYFYGWCFPMGDEVMNSSVFDTEAERDAAKAAVARTYPEDPHLISGKITGECETCGTPLGTGHLRLGPGCRDCR